MKIIKGRIVFLEEVLGTANADPNIHSDYIASKAPDAASREEEVAALGAEEVERKEMTVFSRDSHGRPILWDYQIKGFFKDAASMLRKMDGTKTKQVKAYKKGIDGLVFVYPRQIPIHLNGGEMGTCQRPLRAQTPQGERVALANSETIPAGSSMEITIEVYDEQMFPVIKECLAYGKKRGLAQWRNSGKGRFKFEIEGIYEKKVSFDLE